MRLFSTLKSFLLQNSTARQTVAKNATLLFLGQILSRLFRAGIVVYAARSLGATRWGAFSYGLGIVTFLTVFSDIGINALITKETSRNETAKDTYLATAFFIKLALLIVCATAVLFLFPYLTNIQEVIAIMPVLIFVFVFDTLRDLGSALSRALEKMQIEAGIQIFTNAAILCLGILLLTHFHTTRSLAFAYAAGSGIGLVAIAYILRSYVKNIFRQFTTSLVMPILATAWPFGLLGLLGTVMLNTDIIMIGWLRSAPEVGYYAAAQKLIQLLYVLPTLLSTSIFPVMARLAISNPQRARDILQKTLAIVILAAIPIAAIGIMGGGIIITFIFGREYANSILAFQILMSTILLVYPSTLLGNALFAYDQQKKILSLVAVGVLGNVAFNFLLIPSFGIEGAAASTVLTQFFTNWLMWRKIKSITHFTVLGELKNLWSLGIKTRFL